MSYFRKQTIEFICVFYCLDISYSLSIITVTHIFTTCLLTKYFYSAIYVSTKLNFLTMSLPTSTSTVWEFFEILPDKVSKAKCLLCHGIYSRGKEGASLKNFSTNNLRDHLQKKHSAEFEEAEHRKNTAHKKLLIERKVNRNADVATFQ